MIPAVSNRVSQTTSMQAPTEGLNAKDPVAEMKPTEAVVLENWFPTPSSVDVRNGYISHATGLGADVETLAFYSNGATQELYGVAGGSVFDVTTAGAVGAAEVTGLGNSRFQTINMGTPGGFFLMMVNGQDKMQVYTGSTWYEDGDGTADVTGVDTADCIHINNFKNRVWLIEENTFNAWYLPVSSIGGAANKLDLSGLFKLGGYLMAMANWTIDNASGIDDYAAFITSEGEVALYKGTDPSSASTWALVGTFRMGKPIGRRCYTKAGADVLVLTTDGAFPLSKALLTDRSQLNLAATDNITDLINEDILENSSKFGWQPIIYPTGKKLIINVPKTENVESHQYVMNTTHGAWTKYTGWNGYCWEVLNNNLYFGSDGEVFQADTGLTDNGSNIFAVCQQAYDYFGTKAIKHFKMVRPVFISEGEVAPSVLLNVDFNQKRTINQPSFTGSSGSEWDLATWDEDDWGGGDEITARWQTVTGIGYSGGLRVVNDIKNISCKWISTDFVYEVGGVI